MMSSSGGTVSTSSKSALVVSDSSETLKANVKNLHQAGLATFSARNAEQAFDIFKIRQIAYIFVDIRLFDTNCREFVRLIRENSSSRYIPIIILATDEDDEKIASSLTCGCDEILFEPFTLTALNNRIVLLEKILELKDLYNEAMKEQLLANRILNNAFDERRLELDEVELLIRSKSVFCGDLFLSARHADGSFNVLLADFTGHGLSAAIGALPVADVFTAMTNKGFCLDEILQNINSKLHTLLPASMFMACTILNISKDLQHIQLWNGGMPDVYVREYDTGNIINKISSSHIPLGIDESSKTKYEISIIDVSYGDQIILYSDGLTEALNSADEMFGTRKFEQCLNENKNDKAIFTVLISTFDEFCGTMKPDDDVTLACISCTENLIEKKDALKPE